MRIIQMLSGLYYGDAIGNDALALDKALKEAGFTTEIYAEVIDKRIPKGVAKPLGKWKEPAHEDVILYHMAIGWEYIRMVTEVGCRKIAIYHNITPPHFYKDYHEGAYSRCYTGLEQVRSLRNTFDYCLAVSEFNKRDLNSYGYKCPIDVLPILIPFEDYKQPPSEDVIRKYDHKGSNILFVGRIVPNKKDEDVIHTFSLYKKYYDSDAKLFLVGNYDENDRYYQRLKGYISTLGIEDVYLPGHIRFDEILAYYSIADVFLCMSEHEGFCVPLVEAMLFEVPIIAYDAGAISETLGDGGILVGKKDFLEIAALTDRMKKDEQLRRMVIRNQKDKLSELQYQSVKEKFLQYLDVFLKRVE